MTKLKNEDVRLMHKLVQDEEGKLYLLMGLNADEEYTEEDLEFFSKIPLRTYPEGLLFEYFRLTGKERESVKKQMNKWLMVEFGYNWKVVRDFISCCYEISGYGIVKEMVLCFEKIFKYDFKGNKDEFEDWYEDLDNVSSFIENENESKKKNKHKTTNVNLSERSNDCCTRKLNVYKATTKLDTLLSAIKKKERRNVYDTSKILLYKICAMFLISPEVLRNGRGKMYALDSTVVNQENFDDKIQLYRKNVVKYFASIRDVEEEKNVIDNVISEGESEKEIEKRRKEKCVRLEKEDIARWMDILPDQILEIEGVIPFAKEKPSDPNLKKLMKMVQK